MEGYVPILQIIAVLFNDTITLKFMNEPTVSYTLPSILRAGPVSMAAQFDQIISQHVLRPIYTVRFLLMIVACDFYSARCSRHGKIVYDFHDIKLPVATIVVGF